MVTKISYLNFLYKFLTHSSIKLRIFIQHYSILTNIRIINVPRPQTAIGEHL